MQPLWWRKQLRRILLNSLKLEVASPSKRFSERERWKMAVMGPLLWQYCNENSGAFLWMRWFYSFQGCLWMSYLVTDLGEGYVLVLCRSWRPYRCYFFWLIVALGRPWSCKRGKLPGNYFFSYKCILNCYTYMNCIGVIITAFCVVWGTAAARSLAFSSVVSPTVAPAGQST